MQKYYQNQPRFNGVYSRENLPKKVKDGLYVINLDNYAATRTQRIAWCVSNNDVIYFDSFGIEHFPQEIKKIFWK